MDNPVFRLEGVVHTRTDTEDFVGPLSLILQLLSKNKIEIEDISVSLILDQYLAYLDEMAAMDLDVASEFVAMASHLTYIKSKMLLAGGEEVTELEELISSLEQLKRRDEYTRIKTMTDTLADMFKRGSGLLTKPQEYIAPNHEYRYSHEPTDLIDAFLKIFERDDARRLELITPNVPMPTRIVYSVSGKASEIVEKLRSFSNLRIRTLFYDCKSRSEIVATLIALLELCKMGSILISGEEEDMSITGTGETAKISFDDLDNGGEL